MRSSTLLPRETHSRAQRRVEQLRAEPGGDLGAAVWQLDAKGDKGSLATVDEGQAGARVDGEEVVELVDGEVEVAVGSDGHWVRRGVSFCSVGNGE